MNKPSELPPARLLVLVLILLNPFSATSFAVRVERLIDTWQPTHYTVNITLDDQLSTITSATALVDVLILKRTSIIDLDFGDLTIDSVLVNSKPASFTHKDGKLKITLGLLLPNRRLQVEVNYHGKPKDGLIFANDKDGKPSAIGDNWPNRVHHWIPTFDHPSAKATVTFKITAPAREEVVANGRLDHVETTSNGTRTWTYSEAVPIPPYCMIIAVGQFKRFEPVERSLTPLSYYVPQSDAAIALKGFAPSVRAVSFLSETIAPYPYEKLAMIVGATRFGGMENSSAIVFTSTMFNPKPPSAAISKTFGIPGGTVSLIAHETVHQWFGDSVTESTWADLWLSEGFANYFANLFVQRYEGEDVFQSYMKQAAANVFTYEKKHSTPIHDRDTEDLMDLLNALNYQKGAWVLHMLHSRLGDDAFFRGIRLYYNAHKNSNASTEDLRAALEKASGKDLRGFFARWVYDTGHPQYELSWQWLNNGSKSRNSQLRLTLRQIQSGSLFSDPLPLTIRTASGSKDLVLKPIAKISVVTIQLRDAPLGIDADPRNTLLKEITVRNLPGS